MADYNLEVCDVSFTYKNESGQVVKLQNGKTVQATATIRNTVAQPNTAFVAVALFKDEKLYDIKSDLISFANM